MCKWIKTGHYSSVRARTILVILEPDGRFKAVQADDSSKNPIEGFGATPYEAIGDHFKNCYLELEGTRIDPRTMSLKDLGRLMVQNQQKFHITFYSAALLENYL